MGYTEKRRVPDLSFLNDEPTEVCGGASCDDGIPERCVFGDVEEQILKAHEERVAKFDLKGAGRPAVLFECLEHPEWGKLNAEEMSNRFGSTPNVVRTCESNQRPYKGKRVVRAGRKWTGPVMVRHAATGRLFSVKSAAAFFRCSPASVKRAADSGERFHGHRFEYLSDGPRTTPAETAPPPPRRRCGRVCKPVTSDQGETFPSAKAASEHFGLFRTAVSAAIAAGVRVAGRKWKLATTVGNTTGRAGADDSSFADVEHAAVKGDPNTAESRERAA